MIAAAFPLVAAGLWTMPATAGASADRAAVAGGASSWTAHAASAGPAAPRSGVSLRVYLAPRGGEAAVEAAVAAVSTPGSASYHHFLTPAQYRTSYEPTAQAVAQVSSWLQESGFRVTGVEASHRYVAAAGTVAMADSAFDTTLSVYRHAGQTVFAPSRPATVPASVSSLVVGVTGLDTTQVAMKPSLTGPPPAFENGRPCSIYYGQLLAQYKADYTTPLPKFHGAYRDYAVCGYTPVQFRTAYEGNTSLNGSGVTVAITDAYAGANILSDANHYARVNGEPQFAPGQFSQSLPSQFTHRGICGPTGWEGEETLDVEAVHGMAQSANVIYYAAPSCYDTDLLDTLNRVADQNQASIVTNSWGDLGEEVPTGEVAAYQQFFNQAAMQGISVMFSSGDNGDEVAATGIRQTDFPADSPSITAVGGTTTAIGAYGNLEGQTGWGTEKYVLSSNGSSWVQTSSFLYGAGGGYSALFNRPSYQDGVVPNVQSGRAVPDVAMDADPTTGMLIGLTQRFPDGHKAFSEYRIGGTSLASPLFAGMTALAQQNAGGRLGFLNPSIYHQAKQHSGAFADVLSYHDANVRVDYANGVNPSNGVIYSVRTFDQDSSLQTRSGWDPVTGVGVPTPAYFSGSSL